MIRRPPRSTLFPYTTLFRSPLRESDMLESQRRLYDLGGFNQVQIAHQDPETGGTERTVLVSVEEARRWTVGDRKSTRLNSSHLVISYAVFCLKKKEEEHKEA